MQPKRLVILLPVLALLSTGWLPFVNDATLWFGIPSIVVWVGVWCVLASPLLMLALRTYSDDDTVDAAELGDGQVRS
jgi:hypothetical protein